MTNGAIKLKKLLDHAGVKPSEFARLCGYSYQSGVQRALDPREYDKEYFSLHLVKKYAQALIDKGAPPLTREDIYQQLLSPEDLEVVGAVAYGMQDKARRFVHMPSDIGVESQPVVEDDFNLELPVYGGVPRDGGIEIKINEAHIMSHLPPHGGQYGVEGAFYISIVGESMSPRFYHNERAAVHPGLLPDKGDDCVVIDKDGVVHVRRFISISDDALVVEQLNPHAKITYDRREVQAVYAIVGRA